MPKDFTVSETRLISDPDTVVFELFTDVMLHREKLVKAGIGSFMNGGKVTAVDTKNVRIHYDSGEDKVYPLNTTRARQLMSGETTRK